MSVCTVLALLALSVTDTRALRPERSFVHELTTRTTKQTHRGFGGNGSSLEEALSKKRSARADEQEAARAESAETSSDTVADSTMSLFLLSESPTKGGRCIDGTQAGYYYGPPSSGASTTWVFMMNGGGGCSNASDCAAWSIIEVGDEQATKGSSGWQGGNPVSDPKIWSDSYVGRSFLSSDHTVNPGFHDAHHVRIPYCTGDSHGGQIGDPQNEEHGGLYVHEEDNGEIRPLYLDGHLNFRRILRDLWDTHGLAVGNMEHVLLYGGSAGGKGVFYNCDFLQGVITQAGGSSSAVKCAPESGLFMPAYWANSPGDFAEPNESPNPWESWIEDEPRPEGTAGLYGNPYRPPQCEGTDLECASAGMIYKSMQASVYVKQDEFDTALIGNLGLTGEENLVSAEGQIYMGLVGQSVRNTILNRKEGDGAYLTSCYAHGGHAATVNGEGVSYADSLTDWFWDGKVNATPPDSWDDQDVPHFLMDGCTEVEGGPCNPDCDLSPCTAKFIELCVDSIPPNGDETCAECALAQMEVLLAGSCNGQGIATALESEICNE